MWKKAAASALRGCGVLLVGVLLFDALAYFLVPQKLVAFVPHYRAEWETKDLPNHARGYPRGYFRADEQLGFDIRENTDGLAHVFPEASVAIFSNDIGCFDRNRLEDLKGSASYDYFAGDSQTWGYAAYDEKFPTIYEERTGRVSAKCGVPHTGQLHQFGKFKRTVETIGRYPDKVFVGYVGNDPTNDFAHPHTTVIEGFQVDTVDVDGLALVDRDMKAIERKISAWLTASSKSESMLDVVKDELKKWSLTANLAYVVMQRSGSARRRGPQPIYSLDGRYDFKEGYLSSEITERNRDAIRQWSEDARDHDYELTFLLFPPRRSFDDTTHFSELRRLLEDARVDFIDFSLPFGQSGRSASAFYWPIDAHFSGGGNEFVGEYLSEVARP